MDLRILTKLLVKIAGMAVIVWGITGLSSSIVQAIQLKAQGASFWDIALAASLPILVPMVIGFFFLTFPGLVTNTLVRGEDIVVTPSTALWRIEGIAYSLLGVYLIVGAITDSIYHYSRMQLYHKVVENSAYADLPRVLPQDFGNIIAIVAQLIIGTALALGAPGLVKLFRKLRGRGEEA